MLFNSIAYLIFLPLVFLLYWFAMGGSLRRQNILLLVASYYFYASWDWRFLFLLIFSTFLDYFTGLKMQSARNRNARHCWFWLSVFVNLGFLGVFKYYNFFAISFAALLGHFGLYADPTTLQVILPVGISFYTFHGLSYVIDIYKERIPAERDFVDYAVFVCFFPLLVAGPIERATHLLPQVKRSRTFSIAQGIDGLRQILWGLFKKIVIADQCAGFVNTIFHVPASHSGSTLALGAFLFSIQIYGDFSGYSDIAIGSARLLGFDLLRNFAYPYFSRDIAEFWRRWHISLSSWFRDYLYVPLGGSRGGTWTRVRNTFIIFIVSGFWHGANWTFLVWGFLNALYIMPSILVKKNRIHLDIVASDTMLPSLREAGMMLTTFILTTFAWIFFRAESMGHAMEYTHKLFSPSLLKAPGILPLGLLMMIAAFLAVEWIGRREAYGIAKLGLHWSKPLRHSLYYLLILAVFWYANGHTQFIYFQF